MLRKKFIPIIFSISLVLGLIPAFSSHANAETSWLPSKKFNYKTFGNSLKLSSVSSKLSSVSSKLSSKSSKLFSKSSKLSSKSSKLFSKSSKLLPRTSSSMWANLLTLKQPANSSTTAFKALRNQTKYSKKKFSLSSNFLTSKLNSTFKNNSSNKNTGYSNEDKKRIANNVNNLFPKRKTRSTSNYKRTTVKNPDFNWLVPKSPKPKTKTG